MGLQGAHVPCRLLSLRPRHLRAPQLLLRHRCRVEAGHPHQGRQLPRGALQGGHGRVRQDRHPHRGQVRGLQGPFPGDGGRGAPEDGRSGRVRVQPPHIQVDPPHPGRWIQRLGGRERRGDPRQGRQSRHPRQDGPCRQPQTNERRRRGVLHRRGRRDQRPRRGRRPLHGPHRRLRHRQGRRGGSHLGAEGGGNQEDGHALRRLGEDLHRRGNQARDRRHPLRAPAR